MRIKTNENIQQIEEIINDPLIMRLKQKDVVYAVLHAHLLLTVEEEEQKILL